MTLLIIAIFLLALTISISLRLFVYLSRTPKQQFHLIETNAKQPALTGRFRIAVGSLLSLVIFAGVGMGLTLVMLWLFNTAPNVFAQGPGAEVKTSKSVASANNTFDSGEEIVFNVAYSCAAVIDPSCLNVVITDALHTNLEFLDVTSLPDGASVNQVGNQIIIGLGDIPAGDSRVFQISARFPLGTLPGVTATNQTVIDADNADPNSSDIVDVAANSVFQMTVNKSVVNEPQTGVIGTDYETTYQINICNPNNGIGGVALLNAVITDTLPSEVTPILPLPFGGQYLMGPPQQAIWQAGVGGIPTEIPVTAGCFTIEFPVQINSATSGAISGTVVNNVFTVSGNPADDPTTSVGLGPVGNNVTLRDPYYAASFAKSVDSASNHPDDPGVEELPGGPVTYTLTLNNNGTLPISNTVVTDVLPTEIATVTTVSVVPIETGQTVTFSYELDNSGVWTPGVVATVATTFDLSGISKVTSLRWQLGTMPFTITSWSVNVSGNLSDTLTGGSFDNCGGFSGFSEGSPQSDGPDCATVDVIDSRAVPRTDKQISNSNDVKPEGVVTYTLSVFNDSVAHNDVIAPITLADLLPPELEVVVLDGGSYRPATPTDAWYTIVSEPVGTPAPTVAFTPSITSTLLRWEWPSPFQLTPGDRIDLNFVVRVKKGTLPGPLDNRSIVLWDPATTRPLFCIGNQIYTDTVDIDGDGNFTENGCQSDNEPTNVAVFLAMESEKYVLGELDGGIWNKDGLTVPGGQVKYRMHITNLSNITTTNLVVYDIFPVISDTGIIDTTDRGSDWRPNLQELIQAPPGVPLSVEYSQSSNPCRPEVFPSGPPGCTDDWSSTPPVDLTSVQAVRLDFCENGTCLELSLDDGSGISGGSMVLTWTMQAPNDAPNEPQRAWNSFGFTAEGGGLQLLPAEPPRVGIRVTQTLTSTANLGDYVWFDVYGVQNDGIQQPQEPGINGVRVELRDENGDPYDFNNDGEPDYRVTGNDALGNPGYYLFVGLDPALTYTVRFYPPVTYTLGPPIGINYNLSISNTAATTDGLDSDGLITGTDATYGDYVQTQPITFTPSITNDLTWDQGLWLSTDYGDAPNSYNTQASGLVTPADAARHVILPNIYMGNGVDDELDGTPDSTSFLDDAGDGNDDEDGVVFEYYRGTITQPTPIFMVGDTTDLTVTTVVSVPTGYRGYLNAWIDFNRDGDFDDAGEQIATDRLAPVNGGDILVSVVAPTTTITGTSYARFRFSTEAGLGPSGAARDGEIEDYPVLLLPGDYGDLPDGSVSGLPNPPNYPTTLGDDGARHAIQLTDNPTLGSSVDDELDGQPSRNADGDGADENGIVFASDIIPGEVMTLTATASVTDGLLNAWIDFNFDGDFDDLNERLATNLPITAGSTITITTNVPITASQALTAYSRFRFSTDSDLQPTGLALDGEIEDYAEPILPLDFGDLPDSYTTVYTNNGARHVIRDGNNPTLGNVVDAESNGVPSADALGDDTANSTLDFGVGSGDDEDGVTFNSLIVPGKVASITVSTLAGSGGGSAGLLNAWVDFNNNGTFEVGEQVFTNTNLAAGSTNALSFTVPTNAITGTTYLRFRYSSDSDLSPSGLALDGEVEDYRAEIVVVDYGDAPDSYGTTDSQNGPYHIITSTLYMGSQVDDEIDGQPDNTAHGDDQADPPDDEDGVAFDNYSGTSALPVAIMQLGQTNQLTVTTTGTGYLYGWVDLNGDGNFDDVGERVVNGQAVSGVGNTVSVNVPVPTSVTTYTTYVRFRLSDKQDIGPDDPQTTGNEFVFGEVEDYVIQFVDADKVLNVTAESHTSGSDVAIGEVVQYQITTSLPEGTINNVLITDTLGLGLQYLTNTVNVAVSSGVITSGLVESGSPFGNGTDPIFNLDTITNTNTSPEQTEVLTLTFNALVLNTLANQDGIDLTNGFTVSYDNVLLSSTPVTVTVVEPNFTIDKQITTTPTDAGDIVSYTVTYQNNGNTTAFDVTLTDTLPITYLTLDLGSVNISSSGIVTNAVDASSGNTVRVVVDGLDVGASLTVGYSATLTTDVELNQSITNTAFLTYTSLPGGSGTPANPTGSNPPGNSGDPDGERNGDGGVNDYIITDTAQFLVDDIDDLTKAITTTSEAHTGFAGIYERLSIGEIVRYRLVFTLPEGTASNLQVQDFLPGGLQFMNDNTTKVAFIANSSQGITTSETIITDTVTSCAATDLLRNGNSANNVVPVCVLTDTAVSSNQAGTQDDYQSGTDPYFNLGTLVNHDDDVDAELVVIEFNALVLNNDLNDSGDRRENRFRVSTDRGTSPDSNVVAAYLAEPVLVISKQLNTTNIDAGDTISYTLSITNTASGVNAAAAFEVVISDTLPSQLSLAVSPTISSSAIFTNSSSITNNLIYVEFDRLDPGESAQVIITATVDSFTVNGLPINNTAVVTGTSLPGDGTPSNPTGSTTPGDSGDDDGERNGSDGPGGTPDDHYDEDDAAFSITPPPPGKSLIGTSAGHTSDPDVTIGEVITYQVTVDLPEGIVPGLVVTDDIPAGLAYIPGSFITNTGFFSGSFSPGDPTVTSGGSSGDDLIIQYTGNISVTADNDPNNNRVIFAFQTVVTDVVSNVGFGSGQTTLTNTVQLKVGNLPPETSPPVTTTVVEPNMVITKTMEPAEAGAFDNPVITLTVTNDGLSEAFEVIVDDPLANNIFDNITPILTPTGFTYSTFTSGSDTVVRYTGGNIGVDEVVTFVFTAQVTFPITDGILVNNVATVTQATTLPGPDPNERNEPPVDDNDTLTTLSLSLGNRVWYDLNNDGDLDANENGIDGVVLQLLDSDGNPYDYDPATLGIQTYTTTTTSGGYYTFTKLLEDAYRVRVVDSNFQATGVLSDYLSSSDVTETSTPDLNQDSDDNGPGFNIGSNITSEVITLTYRAEPTNEADEDSSTADNNSNLTVDFGFYQPLRLGNRVWHDTNNSGDIDGSELGLANVVVNLLDSAGNPVNNVLTGLPYTITTDAQGYYTFTNLVSNTYIIEIDAVNFQSTSVLSRYISSSGLAEENNPDTNGDNNDNGVVNVGDAIRSNPVTLTPNSEPTGEDGEGGFTDSNSNLTVDFGFYQPVELGNRVWYDIDNDGQFDTGETGLGGVTLTLLQSNGITPVNRPGTSTPYTVTTDATGYYTFTDLISGSYVVEIEASNFGTGGALENYISSFPTDPNADNNQDEDDNGIDDPNYLTDGIQSSVVTVTNTGEPLNEDGSTTSQIIDDSSNLTVDFGFYQPLRLGNRVWFDADDDGLLEAGENGIGGVIVNLLDDVGNPVNNILTGQPYTTTTDATGYYTFTNLISGTYVVEIDADNFLTTGVLSQVISSRPNEVNGATGDNDDNGVNAVSGGIRSNPTSLTPGNTPTGEGDEDGTLLDGNSDLTLDFGFFEPLSLGNRVWSDQNNDGNDSSESGFSGVVLNLLDSAGNPVTDTVTGLPITTTTDAQGYYTFTNLISATYIVELDASNFGSSQVLENYISSTPTETDPNNNVDENDNGLDNADPATNGIRSGAILLTTRGEPTGETLPGGGSDTSTSTNFTVDFGLYQPVELGNRVWFDADNNGQIDTLETGIDGVVLTLLQSNGSTPVNRPGTSTPYTVTTNVNGYYTFTNLLTGSYVVQIAPVNFQTTGVLSTYISSTPTDANPDDDTTDIDDNGIDNADPAINGISSGVITVTLGAEPTGEDGSTTSQIVDGNSNLTVDFGFYQPFRLGNRVWFDANDDGLNDSAEPGIGGVEVVLYAGDGTTVLSTTTTTASGYYTFTRTSTGTALAAGNYFVEVAASNFIGSGPLVSHTSSITNIANGLNGDLDDNGVLQPSGAVRSGMVILTPNGEPTGEVDEDGSYVDGNSNLTVDFGFVVYDFGDLPNDGLTPANYATATYPTTGTLAARHAILPSNNPTLGSTVDSELDGQPARDADGDDLSGSPDDEDGIQFSTAQLTPGETIIITATVSVTGGNLNAWIDFNGDGDFNDAGEQISSDRLVSVGTNSFTVSVPLTATTGITTYSRFRLSSETGLTPTGRASDGEVEDYPIATGSFDLGDLPNGYGTTLAGNGPRHSVLSTGNPTLGSTVDVEADGQPTANADGDDTSGSDDEDGVQFSGPLVPGETTIITVTASSAAAGSLNAWIDLNNDGDFGDAGEQLAFNRNIGAGASITLSVSVPVTVTQGITAYSRFRFSSDTDLPPTGFASDGEVEDYGTPVAYLDWGDLPDDTIGSTPDYPTQFKDDGPRHVISSTLYLGSRVDAEADGQPAGDAAADDSNTGTGFPANGDDEDGVIFTPLIAGQASTFTITASQSGGYLNAWIDFNGDGDFNDSGEQIAASQSLNAGGNNFNVNVPLTATTTVSTYMRFRFSTQPTLLPTGLAPDGEVEDYVSLIASRDYGDLPDSYDTTEASGGAYHSVDPTIYLGSRVDAESDGQPTPNADGDDNSSGAGIPTNGDDEDGITFVTPLVPGEVATITVTAVGDGNFSGWIDFNADGSFGAGERVFSNTGLTTGTVTLTFTVPTTATPGSSYARFRYTTDSLSSHAGSASDGEVEDYQISLVEVDYGDLPDSSISGTPNYPTTYSDDGARHVISSTVYLGNRVDVDDDGQPSANADGDDTTDTAGTPTSGSDDEDGIRFLTPLMPGETAQIEVTSTDGALNAWIDFDGDGVLEVGEQVFNEQAVNSGTQVLTITVPASVSDTLYSRFRLTANNGEATTPTGIAPNGEVEDYVLLSLGDQVWLDSNNDGLLNGGESGLGGVTVTLVISGTTTPIATTVTDGSGNYLFTGLTPGDYQVIVAAENFQSSGPLFGYNSSTPTDPNPEDDTTNSDDNGLNSDTPAVSGITSGGVTLTPGGEPTTDGNGSNSNLTVDFGFYPALRLGNRIWFDTNNDGQLAGGETGAANVIVTLLDGSGSVVNNPISGQPYTTTTDASGYYTFTNLVSGTYQVQVEAVNFQTNGALEGYTSSDPTETDPNSGVGGGIDNDDNGLDDPLYVTNGIRSGVITLTVGAEPTSEVDEDGQLPDDNSNLTIDFGFYQLLTLGNLVWYDVDNDGQKDADEDGIGNVVVVLLDSAGQVLTDTLGNPITTTTDANGEYIFTDLISGTYQVQITNTNFLPTGPLADFISSTPTESNVDGNVDGDDNGVDDPDPVTSGITSGPITIVPLTEPDTGVDGDGRNGNQTVDFGFFEPLRLGNRVWIDENSRNGQIDSGSESGVTGVVLNLLDSSGKPVTDTVTGLPLTTTTDGSGYYTFTNLVSGTYIVEVDAVNFQGTGPLEGYLSTTPTESNVDGNVDSDDNGIDDTDPVSNGIRSGPVTLIPNSEPTTESDETGDWPNSDSNLTVDFGFVRPASLGNYVWVDSDGDGEQDPTEEGLNGVTVNLWADTDNDGTPDTIVLTTTTTISGTQNGYYQFEDLISGIPYQVEFELPTDYEFTTPNQPGDTTIDSDADVTTGLTPVVTLTPGENNTTIDAGVYQPGIEVDKAVAIAEIVPNQVVTYTITITNTGDVLLNPVSMTDTLEAGLSYFAGSATPAEDSVSGQQLVWNDVTNGAGLAPGANTEITLLVSVTTLTGTYQNTAVAEGTHPTGSITDTDTVPVIVSDPTVELSKNVVTPGAVDGIITFTIRLTNTGPSTLDQVPLFDRFSGPIEYIGGNVVADSVDNTNGVLSWNDLTTSLGNMAPGQVFEIETVFQITADSTNFSMTNLAEVTGARDEFGNEANDDDASVVLDNEPTAIELQYFEANRQGENVILNWATAVEIDNFGFRLLRSNTGNRADAVEIAFVPGQGQGTGSGATYTYIDQQAEPSQSYTYWLVDVDLNGTETDHPPVTVTPTGVDSGGGTRLYLPLIIQDDN